MGDLYHPASLNPYSYVEGNPVRYIDPMGYAASMPEEAEVYVTMREYHERLYEAMYQGQVHSEHFLKKPIQERLSLAYQAFQRDGLRAALYETSDFMEKAVARWDNFMEWGYSTEPAGRKTYPGTADFLEFLFEDVPSYSDLAISSGISTGISAAEFLEICGKSKVFYNTVSVVATAVFVIPDVLNTWTADSGNTNFKRLQKTGIQIAGAAASFGVGYASGKALVYVTAKTKSFKAGLAAAEATNAVGAYMIQQAQMRIYEDWGIH